MRNVSSAGLKVLPAASEIVPLSPDFVSVYYDVVPLGPNFLTAAGEAPPVASEFVAATHKLLPVEHDVLIYRVPPYRRSWHARCRDFRHPRG